MRNEYETAVLKRILPSKDEEDAAAEMGQKLISAVADAAGVPAMMTGSVARGTWVRGDKDIDIFMQFPPEISREELRERGLAAAYAVVERFGGTAEEMYAEHPYLNAVIDGFDVDLVPCYLVNSTAEMKCAVDRTPFHTRYLKEKILPLREDVLLLKQFCKAGGVYGSDHMTGGFSGYLCELLTLAFGGFSGVLEAASAFRPHVVIDIEGFYPDKKAAAKLFAEPFVVIDPTDKDRNVAAAVTMTKFAEFIVLAHNYLQHPSMQYFTAEPKQILSREEFCSVLKSRGTALFSMVFKTPDFIAETVVPQLRKTEESISSMLSEAEFTVLRSGFSMGDEHSILLFELAAETLPAFAIREGPPAWVLENADKFTAKYASENGFAGPWISDGRWYTEVPRKYVHASDFLNDTKKILSGSLGKHVRLSLEEGYAVYSGESVWNDEFAPFLAEYFFKTSASIRKMHSGD